MANFFRVNDSLYFVDLPGYGFASTAATDSRDWQALMDGYLSRSVIQRFLFLWDPRRDLDTVDFKLAMALSQRAPLSLVLTKGDKLSRSERVQRQRFLESSLKSSGVNLVSSHCVSSLKKDGIVALRDELIAPKP